MNDRFEGFDRKKWCPAWTVASFCSSLFAAVLLCNGQAHANQSTFRSYGVDQGLTSLSGECMLQDRAGYMLVCSEHGLFSYDGRRFENLGTEQGLRQGGRVFSIALTASGRVAVGFADEVFVSDQPSDASHPPETLSFRPVLHPGLSFYRERVHRLAPWRDGLVLLTGKSSVSIVVPVSGPPRVETIGYDLSEQGLLEDATAVFSVRGQLWETFADGRLCAANPGAVKCYGTAQGLRGGSWLDVVAGPGGRILARSATSVGTFDPASGRWSVVKLPDQGGQYVNYPWHLGLYRTPDGKIITQADHGLAVLEPDGWRMLTVQEGAPSGSIMNAMTDATGQLWFQILGRGLVRWVGYGHWENVEQANGLTGGVPWETVRTADGSLWVSTDTGVDEIARVGSSPQVTKVIPGGSFAIATGPHDELWGGDGAHGVRVIDAKTGVVTRLATPPVNAILAADDGAWLGTEAGLFWVDAHGGKPVSAVLEASLHAEVVSVVSDDHRGLLYLSGGRLRHRHQDGTDVALRGPWPRDGFEPLSMAVGQDGGVWIGGEGGLFRFVLSGDRVVSYRAVPTVDTRSNTIAALMVDRRGWVWVGTALGISVFDGRRWVSVDTDGGLLSDDVSQNGIREDPDGSVWIATTHGLSHLLKPDWLFASHPIKAVVSEALVGDRPVAGGSTPYTDEALTVQFGTPNYGAERSVLFRYRLSDVDAGWVETSSGAVRYPFVPPGRHLLTVVAYDQLTHRSSRPATLTISVDYPWWRQWWSETLWSACALALVYGITRFRVRALVARQAELTRLVAEATCELSEAKARAEHQAAHDSLTGLLNRCEIERRLAARLSPGRSGAEMVVALIDIDHFKRVNDDHGHLGGDRILRQMGSLVSRSIRDGECAGRYGGEEILLVLDDSDTHGADRILALHHAVRREVFETADTTIRVTCSIGLAWAAAGDDWESLIGRADEALYEAKQGGRDRVIEGRRVEPVSPRIVPGLPRPDHPIA